MSGCASISSNSFFPNRIPTPTSSDESASIDKETLYRDLPVEFVEQFDPHTLKVWDHFFSCIPSGNDQEAWQRFFDAQQALENRPIIEKIHQLHDAIEQNHEKLKTLQYIQKFPFVCPAKDCSNSYQRKLSLQEHFEKKHPDQPALLARYFRDKHPNNFNKVFSCPFQDCSSRYSRKDDLTRHAREKH